MFIEIHNLTSVLVSVPTEGDRAGHLYFHSLFGKPLTPARNIRAAPV